MKNWVKLVIVVSILVGGVFWVGYSSRRAATIVRSRARTFEPTAARLERGRYIVEGPAHCFECHSEVDWEHSGGQPKTGRKGGGKKENRGEQPRAGVNRRARIARRPRLAVLRLQQIDVAAARDVVRVAARAPIAAVLRIQWKTAAANRAG